MANLFSVKDKVVLITGGYGVLGRLMVHHFAAEGAKVVILGRNADAGDALVEEVEEKGHFAAFVPCDVVNREMVEEAYEAIMAQFDRIDVLINGAGGNMSGATIPPDKTVFDLDVDALKQVVDLNLFGTIIPTMVFSQAMAEQKQGVIINISSESAIRPLSRVCGYGAAKAAVTNFTQYMAGELALKFGPEIRVNAIAPGFFLTEQNRSLLTNADGSYTERAKQIIEHTPFRRFG